MPAMDVAAAMSQIYAIQGAMQISHPANRKKIKVSRVYHYWPDVSEVVDDFPAWVNDWTAPTLEFQSALLTGEFTVHMELLASIDVDVDEAADVASAFYPVVVEAFAANVKLGLTEWLVRRLRGGDPTLAVIAPLSASKGRPIVGLDLYLDLYCLAGIVIQPGDPPS